MKRFLHNLAKFKTLAVVAALSTGVMSVHGGIVAYWNFDEQSGAIAHDSIQSFHGTLSPNGAAFTPGGISGNAISLNQANNGFVNIGNHLGFTNGSFSIVAWVKMSVGIVNDASHVVSKHAAFTRNGYYLGAYQTGANILDNRAMFAAGEYPSAALSTNRVSDGVWHQIAGVYKAGGLKLVYVDGAPAEAAVSGPTIVPNSVALLIGGANFNGVPTGRFTGLIDEVQIYDHALSDAEVDFLFQNPTQTVLDCGQQVALLQSQLTAAQATIAALDNELLVVEGALEDLTSHFQTTFRNSQFQIPGATVGEKTESLVLGVKRMNLGQQQSLFYNLGGTK